VPATGHDRWEADGPGADGAGHSGRCRARGRALTGGFSGALDGAAPVATTSQAPPAQADIALAQYAQRETSSTGRAGRELTGAEGTLARVGAMTAIPEAHSRVAVVTGASSGIGEATARTLAAQGLHVVAVARRAERIERLAAEIGGTAVVCDVTDEGAVSALAERLTRADVLVNNAGGAKGLQPVAEADFDDWRWMWETNVMGTLRVTRALLPALIASGDGLIVTVTSIAALEVYDGGAGYTAAKHAQGALHQTLRGELLGKPVRLTEIAPGAVQTEFSLVRFGGDTQRAEAVYAGITPLVAQDVAEVIGFVASRPAHVNLDQIVIRPRDQASASRFHRQV
jgi:NADP-dependent 3-hydroxy acid dehydrogenase YdfG